MFTLHTRLAEDCIAVGDFPLCRLLLMNDTNYPWFILVPRREGIREIFELSDDDQKQLLWECSHLSKIIAEHFSADKMNVAALGNMVPQLHIHHIVRFTSDPAWPEPVWGHAPAKAYSGREIDALLSSLREVLTEPFQFAGFSG
jgi:diadenosine tetraphosphate (Ap4A) HIT family hydrolase